MAAATTNLTTLVADSVAIWSPAAQDSLDLHQIFVGTSAVVELASVSIPNADAVEHELHYFPSPGQVASTGRVGELHSLGDRKARRGE